MMYLKPLQNEEDEGRLKYVQLQWPIFILHNNGEVYFTNTTLGTNRYAYVIFS